jgi:hypothetical protein
MYKQQVLVNDTLNLIRGKSIRYILEDGDLRMIANLVAVIDEMGLKYDPEGMVYRDPKETQIRAKINEERDRAIWKKLRNKVSKPEDDFFRDDEDAPEPEPEEEPDEELRGAFEHAWDMEIRRDLREKKKREAARLERNRKAREKYHAKKVKAKRGRPRKEK